MVENLCTCFACTGPAKLKAAEARVVELEAAIENYLLWAPGRRGHAAAHRELQAVTRGEK